MGLQCTNLVRNARMMIIKVVVVQNIIVRFLISLHANMDINSHESVSGNLGSNLLPVNDTYL